MQPGPISLSKQTIRRAGLVVCAAALAVSLAPLTSAAAREQATSKLKLPAERTSATGNFFTLEAYDGPTSSKPVANFEVKVCTSKNTPADTELVPEFFTLSLGGGGTIHWSAGVAKSPALVVKPLKPLQCVEGWLGFTVPRGKTVSKLDYDYKSTISWTVG